MIVSSCCFSISIMKFIIYHLTKILNKLQSSTMVMNEIKKYYSEVGLVLDENTIDRAHRVAKPYTNVQGKSPVYYNKYFQMI